MPDALPQSPPQHSKADRPPFFDRRKLLARRSEPTRRGLLAGMRIRKKLVFLHTVFSLTLAGILLVALRPALGEVVARAELDEARQLLDVVAPTLGARGVQLPEPAIQRLLDSLPIRSGSATELGLDPATTTGAMAAAGKSVPGESVGLGQCAVLYTPASEGAPERFHVLSVVIDDARRAVTRLYIFVVGALLAVYALVAVALEALVLPQAVYEPIRRTLAADRAVKEGRQADELVPPAAIPADELGEIMISRNESILKLRQQEAALADALLRLEAVANDLRRKNHLLEAAQRNLADADRLASLGMMSAGIAHELNTPLAVLKGLVEKLAADPGAGVEPAQAALMRRVVGRIERLGDSLLDFARVRPPQSRPAVLRTVVSEAITLVRLDREAGAIEIRNSLSEQLVVECDADRMVQVFVNLIRNAADAIASTPGHPRHGLIVIDAEHVRRGEQPWVVIRIQDDGPGIDSAILARLFEPFASTRLDSRGTGLGLAVAEGIVREHAGMILARNRAERSGAVFEILLPVRNGAAPPGAVESPPNTER